MTIPDNDSRRQPPYKTAGAVSLVVCFVVLVAVYLQFRGDFAVGGGRNDPHVVEDGHLVTARYAVDAKRFGHTLVAKLTAAAGRTT